MGEQPVAARRGVERAGCLKLGEPHALHRGEQLGVLDPVPGLVLHRVDHAVLPQLVGRDVLDQQAVHRARELLRQREQRGAARGFAAERGHRLGQQRGDPQPAPGRLDRGRDVRRAQRVEQRSRASRRDRDRRPPPCAASAARRPKRARTPPAPCAPRGSRAAAGSAGRARHRARSSAGSARRRAHRQNPGARRSSRFAAAPRSATGERLLGRLDRGRVADLEPTPGEVRAVEPPFLDRALPQVIVPNGPSGASRSRRWLTSWMPV